MDDPWGSPWADELQNDNDFRTQRIGEVAGNLNIGNANNALRDQLGTTWTDSDNAFGDWEESAVENRNLGLDGTTDEWHTQRDTNIATVKDSIGGLGSQWDDIENNDVRGAPHLSPSLLPKPKAISREPSPAPWASTNTANELSAIEERRNSAGSQLPSKSTLDVTADELVRAFDEPQDGPNGELSDVSGYPSTENNPEGDTSNATTETAVALPDPTSGIATDQISTEQSAEPVHTSSRPSSSPSEGSQHDGPLAESPRTSLDEEPKRSQTAGNVTTELQGSLQDLDDSEHEQEESTVPTGLDIAENKEAEATGEDAFDEDEDEFGEFGDFEEGASEHGDMFLESHNMASEMEADPQDASNIRSPDRVLGPANFDVDLAAVENIFQEENDETAIEATTEKVFIPDKLIADTFATIDERKAWSRISRYGPMRKHDSGNDESYVRIAWTKSQVKQETQKIVGRWLEEDRNNGHVVLGGTGKGGSIFGWNDPNAAPVPLASVFEKKKSGVKVGARPSSEVITAIPREWPKGLVRNRSQSKSRSSSHRRGHSSMKSGSSNTNVIVGTQSSLAQFGSNSSASMQTASDPVSSTSKSGSFEIPLSLKPPSTFEHSRESSYSLQSPPPAPAVDPPTERQSIPKPRPISMPPPASITTNHALPSAAIDLGDDDNDNDDEWGEMVSSPIVTEAPKFPTPRLRHKKSMSLGGNSSSELFPPLKNPQVTKIQSGYVHTSKPKLNQISVPVTSQTPSLPSPTLSPILPPPQYTNTPQISPISPTKTAIFQPASPILSTSTAFTNTWSQPASPITSNTPSTDIWSRPASTPPISTQPFSAAPQTNNQNATPVPDPWASVDFSFFDKKEPSASVPDSISNRTSTTNPFFSSGPKPHLQPQLEVAELKPRMANSSAPAPSPPLQAHSSSTPNSKAKMEMEQDELVKKVVSGLPDLSYMFKR